MYGKMSLMHIMLMSKNKIIFVFLYKITGVVFHTLRSSFFGGICHLEQANPENTLLCKATFDHNMEETEVFMLILRHNGWKIVIGIYISCYVYFITLSYLKSENIRNIILCKAAWVTIVKKVCWIYISYLKSSYLYSIHSRLQRDLNDMLSYLLLRW